MLSWICSSLLVTGGLFALFVGGEALVSSGCNLARRFGIAPAVIGLTVVAFATSAPEIAVGVVAALEGKADLVLGNVVGSNMFNVLMAVGVAAVFTPLVLDTHYAVKQSLVVLLATILVILLTCLGQGLGPTDGLVLVAVLAVILTWLVRQSRRRSSTDDLLEVTEAEAVSTPLVVVGVTACVLGSLLQHHDLSEVWTVSLWALISAAGLGGCWALSRQPQRLSGRFQLFVMAVAGATLVLGSEILVEGAVQLGRNFSISEAIIGLTIVAVGTSAPELATSLAAARRGEHDLIVGNALGSNLFNLLAVLGLSALAWPLDLESSWKSWSTLHLPLSLAPLVLLVPLARTGRRLGRVEGLVLVVCWFAYIASLSHLDPSAVAMP
jgi:cation:H+ antiporter